MADITKHILVLSWRDPKHPLAGGAEQVMHEHMKGWVKAGFSVTFFSSARSPLPKTEMLDGIQIIRGGNELFLGVQLAAWWWFMFAKHKKFDLIVDEFHGYPFFTPLFSRTKKLAVLQEVAKEVWLLNELPKPFNWIIGWIGYLTEPLIFLLYKHIPFMVGSDSAKKDLTDFGIPEKNITVVPHGVKLALPQPMPKKEQTPTIVFLGALAKDKGIEDAIETFGLLGPRYQFWIIGKGAPEYVKELEKRVHVLGIEKTTKFWGFVSQEEKFRLLAKAHLLVNPSAREGWGLVNIEANSVETPVVAYNSVGLIDSVSNGVSGVIVANNTPQALADTSRNVLSNKNEYEKLSKGSKKWSESFSWNKSQQFSLKLIEDILYSKIDY